MGDTDDAAERRMIAAIAAGDAATVEDLLKRDPALAKARVQDGFDAGATAVLKAYYAIHFSDPAKVGPDNHRVLRALLDSGVELDVVEAAAVGDLERVMALTGDEAAANAYSGDGWTPLHLANDDDMRAALVAGGADIHLRSRNGLANTPLHAAAFAGRIDGVAFFLSQGADPNEVCGYAPIHYAAARGDLRMLDLLKRHRADASVRTADGTTALDLAEANHHRQTAQMIRNW